MVPDNYIKRVIQFAKQGYKDIDFPTYDTDWDSEAYLTVAGPELEQFGARHRRLPQGRRIRRQMGPDLSQERQDREDARCARDLWEKIGYAAWASADPGLQYHTTVNDWHTCPASGEIRASNPCSEYMFLDDTACNLASLNLLTFRDREDRQIPGRKLRARRAAVDRRARNLGDDGAVPLARDRGASPSNSARSASATPISAAC